MFRPASPYRGRAWLRGVFLPAALAAALALVFGLDGCDRLLHHDLPRRLAGLPVTFLARDAAGLAQVRRLHGAALDVQSGAMAIYGGGAVSLWVADARDSGAAEQLVRAMTERIAEGDSPFRPDSVVTLDRREVHTLTGLGMRHFYFRAGRRLIWLAARRGAARAALDEALGYYRQP